MQLLVLVIGGAAVAVGTWFAMNAWERRFPPKASQPDHAPDPSPAADERSVYEPTIGMFPGEEPEVEGESDRGVAGPVDPAVGADGPGTGEPAGVAGGPPSNDPDPES